MTVEFLDVDYSRVAAQVRALQPRALTNEKFADVITIMEWMQAELIKQDAELTKRRGEVAAREEAVTKREHELAIRSRMVHAAAAVPTPRNRKGHGWLRYLHR